MESLLNFNFLKDISVKKNNEKNANDKSLLDNGKSIVINQPDSIENEFNNILSDQELNEDFFALQKQKSKKSKEKLNIESTEYWILLNIGYYWILNMTEYWRLFNIEIIPSPGFGGQRFGGQAHPGKNTETNHKTHKITQTKTQHKQANTTNSQQTHNNI